ncbi:MAG TPA: methionine--tRNA ligase [Gaiellaceae bacterium]|nr:methionine--tRNA ligase [Gaiellaceae bacterium]
MSFYVTTPIYYVNATPHIGHAYTTIAADVLARHHRQRGEETFFLTGTDEHGSNIPRVAEEAGLDLRTFVDRNAAAFREMTERVNASNDFFIRTTDERHGTLVQEFLQRVHDAGDIYEGVYAGLYCSRCEAFYAESELVDGLCPQHGIRPDFVEEKNYFFRLSEYADRLLRLYDERPDFVLPRFRSNEARRFIELGLDDISVSRATQRWGVAVPWDPDQVVYVWVDALINYWSALGFARPDEDLRPALWPEVRHLLGKDILKFHCVIWPALLLAAGLDVPRQLFVHGYLLLDERKMSKSLGNVIDPLDLVDVYGVDPVRFYLFRVATFGQDGSISLEGLHERYERELGNDLGNLLSRTTAMIARYRGGELRPVAGSAQLAAAIDEAGRVTAARLDEFDLTGALETVWDLVRRLNRHVEQSAPWELAKDGGRAADLDRVLYDLADGLRAVAVVLAAYVPDTSARILTALGQGTDLGWSGAAAGRTAASRGIEAAPPLFPRIDPSAAAA